MEDKNQNAKPALKPLLSICASLFLVAAAISMVAAVRLYLKDREYTGPVPKAGIEQAEEEGRDKDYLELDKKFKGSYVMICNVSSGGVWATRVPGKREEDSVALSDGQILKAVERGVCGGSAYYLLDNGLYLNASVAHVEPLASYTELSGYLAITYVSASGVHLRAWADFDADNVVKSVYVGDKVPVKAKVETEKGDAAFLTTEGLYITTDSRYLNDYTSVPEDGAVGSQMDSEEEKP
ncbi:MAG: hypothetical protein Q4D60_03620 [Eubacteriales bacterium]|nr:hypothetical protein [Eubacteriales bacterium]